MRPAPNSLIEKYRLLTDPASVLCRGTNTGSFLVHFKAYQLKVIACDLCGWDHVSVSLSSRVPSYEEMCFIKDLFFRDDEVAMQLHVAKADHINTNKNVLHLWRPQTVEERAAIAAIDPEPEGDWPQPGPIPLPPKDMV
jgi:hypothetical protein